MFLCVRVTILPEFICNFLHHEMENGYVELKCGCDLVQYVRTLGINEQWQFVDVWGFESDLLQLLPRPICAVLLLYPLSDKVFSVSLFDVRYLIFLHVAH